MTFSWIDSNQCNLIISAKDTKLQVFSSFADKNRYLWSQANYPWARLVADDVTERTPIVTIKLVTQALW